MAKTIEVQIKAKDYASAAIAKVRAAVETVKDKSINIRAVSMADDAVARVKGLLSTVKDKTVKIDVKESGAAQANANLGALAGRMRTVAGVASAAVAAVSAIVTGIGAYSVKLAGEYQNVEVAITNMLGSGEKAKALIADLQDFAAKTPFEFKGLSQSAQKLLAFGFTAEQILPTMRAIGDAAAGTGAGAAGIERITLALGQMAAKGRVQADEMLQLTEAGIPAWQMLADKIGTSIPDAMDMVTKGTVDAQTGMEALVNGMEAKFSGLMDQQSKTILGGWSNMMDGLEQAATQVGLRISEAFNLPDLFGNIGDQLQEFANTIKTVGISEALGNWKIAITAVAGAIGGVLVAALYASLPAIAAFGAAIWTAMAPLLPFAAAGAAIAVALYAIVNPIETVTAAMDLFGASAETTAEVTDTLSEAFVDIGDAVNYAIDIFYGIGVIIEEWVTPYIQMAGDALYSLAGAVQEYASAIWQWIQDMAARIGESISGVIDDFMNMAYGALPDWAKTCLSYIGDMVSTAIGWLSSLRATLANTMNEIAQKGAAARAGDEALRDSSLDVTQETEHNWAPATPVDYSNFHSDLAADAGGKKSGSKRSAADREAEKLQRQIETLTQKIKDAAQSFSEKITDITGTAYEKGIAKLEEEIAKVKDDMQKAADLGIDTTALQEKLDQYSSLMKEKLVKQWKEANEDLRNETALTMAKLTSDVQAQAEAQYQIDLVKLDRQKEAKLKEVAISQDAAEAKLAVEAWYNAQLQTIQKARETELRKEPANWNEAWKNAMQNALDNMQSIGGQMMTATTSIAQSMADGFTNMFTDALTLDFKNIGDSFTSMLRNMLKAMAQFLANQAITSLFGRLLGGGSLVQSGNIATAVSGAFTSSFGSFGIQARAGGGPVTGGRAYLVGENGPELFIPSKNGSIANRIANPSSNAPQIQVVVQNNTGTAMQASQRTTQDNGRQLTTIILSTVQNAINTNEYGMRDTIAGAKGGY